MKKPNLMFDREINFSTNAYWYPSCSTLFLPPYSSISISISWAINLMAGCHINVKLLIIIVLGEMSYGSVKNMVDYILTYFPQAARSFGPKIVLSCLRWEWFKVFPEMFIWLTLKMHAVKGGLRKKTLCEKILSVFK